MFPSAFEYASSLICISFTLCLRFCILIKNYAIKGLVMEVVIRPLCIELQISAIKILYSFRA